MTKPDLCSVRAVGGGLGAEEVWQCTGVGGQRVWCALPSGGGGGGGGGGASL